MRQSYRQYVRSLFCTGAIAVICTALGAAIVPILTALDRIDLSHSKGYFFMQEIQRSPLWSPLVIAVICGLCVLLYKPVKRFLEREIPSPVERGRGWGWYILSLLVTTLVLYFLKFHITPLVWLCALLPAAVPLLIDLFRCRKAKPCIDTLCRAAAGFPCRGSLILSPKMPI